MADDKTPAAQGDTKAAGDKKTADGAEAAAAAAAATAAAESTAAATAAAEAAAAAAAAGEAGKKPGSKDDAAPPQSKAPEKYSLTLPDGGRIDEHDLALIETIAREHGWTNEEAQARVTQHADAVSAQATQFEAATKADATYGGERLDETLKHATVALDKLRPKGTPRGDALRALLDKSGYGSNLEVVSLLADLGKMMAEDGSMGGDGGAGDDTKKDAASLIYPNAAK